MPNPYAVDPTTAAIINVTADGTYTLWQDIPQHSQNGLAPFYFAGARVQVDNLNYRRFFLATDDGNMAIDDRLEFGKTLPGSILFALGTNNRRTANSDPATSPNVCELTAHMSGTGIYILAANNTIDFLWFAPRVYWVTVDATPEEYGVSGTGDCSGNVHLDWSLIL